MEDITGFVYDDEKIYFVLAYMPALLFYDCCSGNVEVLVNFPEEAQMIGAFERIIKYDDKIYLFPCYAGDVYCFDLGKNKFYSLESLITVAEKMPQRKVFDAFIYNDKIYGVCRYSNIIVCVNPQTDNGLIYNVPLANLIISRKIENTLFSVFVKNDSVYIPYADSAVIEFNMDKEIFNVTFLDGDKSIHPEDREHYIMGICIDNVGKYWMYNACGELFKYFNNVKTEIDMPDDFCGSYDDGLHIQPAINNMFLNGSELYFFLRSEYSVLKYNILTENFIWQKNKLSHWKEKTRKIAYFGWAQPDKDKNAFWIYGKNDGAIHKWNCSEGFAEKIYFKITFENLIRVEVGRKYLLHLFSEKDDLISFIRYFKCELSDEKPIKTENCGRKIYQECISQ